MDIHQKALNKIVKSCCPNCHDENGCSSCDIEKTCNCTAKSWVDTLQELIDEHQQLKEENQKLKDKETPKKPRRDRLFYNCHNGECDKSFIYYCPVCNVGSVEDMNYCGNCGQKLDWSDEEGEVEDDR